MTTRKSRTIETTTSIDTAKLKRKLTKAAMPFIGATDYEDGLLISIGSYDCAAGFDNGENIKHKHNGVYFMAECLQETSDAEIAFIRKNFDVKPFHHYYASGRDSIHLHMTQKQIDGSSDGDFAASVRKHGLAVSTGNTVRPAATSQLDFARQGAKFAGNLFVGAAFGGGASTILGIAALFGSFAFSAIALPLAGYGLAAAAVTAVVGGLTHLVCQTSRVNKSYLDVNSKDGQDPLDLFNKTLDAKFDADAPAAAVAAKPARKPSTRVKKITIAANDVFEKPVATAETATPAAPAKTSKREIKL